MAKFINDFTNYNVNQKELEKYNVNYITKDFKYKQADIVYKIQGKEIFYLIEHQTKVDYTMSYRMLNYCIEIIRNVVENKEINRSTYRYPIVIPIVLYTGDKKWTASTTFAESQIIENGFVEKTIDIKYKLIDINKIEIKDLLKEKTMLANALILEKCKNNDDVIKYLRIMIENQKDKAELQKLKRLVLYLYEDVPIEELSGVIKESEGEENMSTIRERLRDEYINERKRGRQEGRQEGIVEGIMLVIKNMLQLEQDDTTIMKFTKAKKEDIEKAKTELGMTIK